MIWKRKIRTGEASKKMFDLRELDPLEILRGKMQSLEFESKRNQHLLVNFYVIIKEEFGDEKARKLFESALERK